jgi:hypothetical protein
MIAGMARVAGEGFQLRDRAEADPVRFSQGTTDGSRFGDSHLRSVHQTGHIGVIGVSLADKTPGTSRLVNCGSAI